MSSPISEKIKDSATMLSSDTEKSAISLAIQNLREKSEKRFIRTKLSDRRTIAGIRLEITSTLNTGTDTSIGRWFEKSKTTRTAETSATSENGDFVMCILTRNRWRKNRRKLKYQQNKQAFKNTTSRIMTWGMSHKMTALLATELLGLICAFLLAKV